MKQTYFLSAVLLAMTIGTAAFAETPRILTLQGASELPGDHDGAQHGVVVRRGSGFPDPIVIEAPAQVVDEEVRAPVRKKTKKKRYGW